MELRQFTYYWIIFLPICFITLAFAKDTDLCAWKYGYLGRLSLLPIVLFTKFSSEISTELKTTRIVCLTTSMFLLIGWGAISSWMFMTNLEPVDTDEICTDYYHGPWLDGLA